MAIKVVTGVPGSGKSYYVMREIIAKNYEWNKEFDEWQLKTDLKPFTLFTNIEKLKLPHINLDEYLKKKEIDYKQFFTVAFQEKVVEKYGRVIIVLDEAQRYFPSDFKEDRRVGGGNDPENSCFYFFEYHRHLGLDVYLLAQKWTRLHQNIVGLAEYQIDAVRRSLSMVGEFRYKFMNGFEVLGSKTIKPDKKVFALYQSMKKEDESKQIRPLHKFLAFGIGLFVVSAFLLYQTVQVMLPDSEKVAQADQVEKKSSPSSSRYPDQAGAAARGDGGRPTPRPDPPEKMVQVVGGGIWQGKVLMYVQVLGEVFRVDEMPYSYESRYGRIYVHVPASVYHASIQSQHEADQDKKQEKAGGRYAT